MHKLWQRVLWISRVVESDQSWKMFFLRFSRQFLKIFKNCLETLELIFETLGDSKNSRNSPQFRILLQLQKTQETSWNSKYSSKLLIFLKILVTPKNSSKLIKELRVSSPSASSLYEKEKEKLLVTDVHTRTHTYTLDFVAAKYQSENHLCFSS